MIKKAPRRVPKVRLACPAGRPIQLRYNDPDTGKEVRLSTNTYDQAEAEQQKGELEARLRLGMQPKRKQAASGPLSWQEFRQRYSDLQLTTLREGSARDAESKLDVIERILKPRTVADVNRAEALHDLQTRLLAGAEGRFGGQRSPHSVRSFMAVLMAALRWGELQGYVEAVPRVRRLKVSKRKTMKGRPITGEEFERMQLATVKVVGEKSAQSWRYLLRGLWESALRLDELMHVAWDIHGAIVPEWPRGRRPILVIPADRQKNDTEESIPMLPGFAALLLETPEAKRNGWAFNPLPVQGEPENDTKRPLTEWVGKIISRIGEAAGVVVEPAKGTPPEPPKDGAEQVGSKRKRKAKRPTRTADYIPAKYASAHDLRRACAERLLQEGISPADIQRILRHASWETTRRHYAPGNVQSTADRLWQAFEAKPVEDVPRYREEVEST